MDSLRTPSKGVSKQSSSSLSNSFSIRFNATDDSLDDIINTTTASPPPPPSSASNTQQNTQQAEESIWKRDFLQNSFFSRKRSNSIENNTLAVPAPPPEPSPSPSNSNMDTTTWARFKGKVNQAMEDIKSSSSSSSNQKVGSAPANAIETSSVNGDVASTTIDSNTTAPSSISEDYLDPQSMNNGDEADNSDSDVDSEIFNGQDETTESLLRLKKPLPMRKRDQIREKLLRAKETTKDVFAGRSSISSKRTPTKTAADASPTTARKTEAEIESGVEMVEDMELPTAASVTGESRQNSNEAVADKGSSSSGPTGESAAEMRFRSNVVPNALELENKDSSSPTFPPRPPPPAAPTSSHSISFSHLFTIISSCISGRNFAISLGLFALLVSVPIPPFLQGVLACLFSIVTVNALYQTTCAVIVALVQQNNPHGPETTPFAIPDYTKMSVCEIPAAEEHKSLKSYCGWLNEINNYDPDNYHMGLTKSVFVKLDGTRLKVSNVANRVPKRSMWNETVIEKKHVIVTRNRTFDLLNCRVEMAPKGLARKRYFNRKYPIQLIIPNGGGSGGGGSVTTPDDAQSQSEKGSPETTEEKWLCLNDFDSTDFGMTILNADTATLQQNQQQLTVPEVGGKQVDMTPSGDEIRLLLFARCDREKEDWYRRFLNASVGAIHDNENPNANLKFVSEKEAQAMRQVTQNLENLSEEERQKGTSGGVTVAGTVTGSNEKKKEDEAGAAGAAASDDTEIQFPADTQFDGLLMTPCSARSHPDYVKFMSKYQTACEKKSPPQVHVVSPDRKSRREKREDDLWKGIDQSLFLGPTADVIWANVLLGRVLYSCLNDDPMLVRIQEFLQKKLSAIKLPNFMEDVTIAQLCLGNKPPLVHRVSQPLMDERGTWIDADLTYEGLIHATVTTKLNLLRLRRQQNGGSSASTTQFSQPITVKTQKGPVSTRLQMSSIYDSDAESTGGSSSESESSAPASMIVVDSAASVAAVAAGASSTSQGTELLSGTAASASSQGSSSRKLLRIVDKITASNLFQSATEISYVQRAMENMSTRIKLRVELKGLVARVVLNIPPPPSDRIWIGFRGPPRLWITAKPALGDHSVDWSIVTNVIENKLCEEVYKYLVYPNMVDVIVPILGQSTYREDE